MVFWQDTPDDVAGRLAAIAGLFTASRDAFHETADRFHWLPAPGSAAAADAAHLPSHDPALAVPRAETGHRMIAEVVQTYLLTASGHLGGLASLYASCEVIFPTPALIRSAIENCAHSVWVLGDDPDEPAENRLVRAYLEELISAEEEKKNAGRMYGKEHPGFVRADRAYQDLKAEILARYPGTTRDDLGRKILNGQKLPGLEAAVTWMYELTQAHGGTIDGRAGSGVYGYLSNLTHPTLYPARRRRAWADDPVAGHRVAYLSVEVSSAEREARAALAAFYNALNYTTSYFGWPTGVIDELSATIEQTMPTFFLDAPAAGRQV